MTSTGSWSPTDASTWEYGVVLQYGEAGTSVAEDAVTAEACAACEGSGGACGYAPPKDYFVCVCDSGLNTSTDCYGLSADELKNFWSTSAATTRNNPTWTITSSRGNYVYYFINRFLNYIFKNGFFYYHNFDNYLIFLILMPFNYLFSYSEFKPRKKKHL